MTFSIKSQEDYIDLANQYLNNIPVKHKKDFATIANALESITNMEKTPIVRASLENRINQIKELINRPELFDDQDQYNEFKSFVLQKVAVKVKEFSTMSLVDKQRYIKEQKEIKKEKGHNHANIENHPHSLLSIPTPTISIEDILPLQEQKELEIENLKGEMNSRDLTAADAYLENLWQNRDNVQQVKQPGKIKQFFLYLLKGNQKNRKA